MMNVYQINKSPHTMLYAVFARARPLTAFNRLDFIFTTIRIISSHHNMQVVRCLVRKCKRERAYVKIVEIYNVMEICDHILCENV